MKHTKRNTHTPGPWSVDPECFYDVTGPDGHYLVVAQDTGCIDLKSGRALATRFANARLIAAAPEMLEALQSIIRLWDNGANPDGAIANAKALIARAEGVK